MDQLDSDPWVEMLDYIDRCCELSLRISVQAFLRWLHAREGTDFSSIATTKYSNGNVKCEIGWSWDEVFDEQDNTVAATWVPGFVLWLTPLDDSLIFVRSVCLEDGPLLDEYCSIIREALNLFDPGDKQTPPPICQCEPKIDSNVQSEDKSSPKGGRPRKTELNDEERKRAIAYHKAVKQGIPKKWAAQTQGYHQDTLDRWVTLLEPENTE